MKWQEIREAFPHQWLIIEAIEAHSENGHRIFDRIAVVEAYPNVESSSVVMRCYYELQDKFPQRELLFIHTFHEELVIKEIYSHGYRPASNQ